MENGEGLLNIVFKGDDVKGLLELKLNPLFLS